MCAIYGKTVCKDVETQLSFITEDKFKNRGIDSSIIEDWDVLPNNQILLHSKENKSSSLFPTILGVYILAESRKIMN
jgi:hypothetical protein